MSLFFLAMQYGDQFQEWSDGSAPKISGSTNMKYLIRISFVSDIFGTFRQSVVFDFSGSSGVYLRKDICVDVEPDTEDEERADEAKEALDESHKALLEKLIRQPERWDTTNSTVVDFDPPIVLPEPEDAALLTRYPPPRPRTFRLGSGNGRGGGGAADVRLTRQNYRSRMHELLCVEEMAQFERLTQFNIVTTLEVTKNYLLSPTSTNSSTAKYARQGELFGKMTLGQNLSEDTPAGRLILTNCQMLMLSKPEAMSKKAEGKKKKASSKRVAYISAIEDTGKSTLYLRLSSRLVTDLCLDPSVNDEVELEVQFQLNRIPLCEMHQAIDQLLDVELVYPDICTPAPQIPWTPGRQWPETSTSSSADQLAPRLNAKQREAVLAITAPLSVRLPPLLVIGPYGTGKTFTLGQAVRTLLLSENNGDPKNKPRILVCTHSNSAADLYVKEYLHPLILSTSREIKLRRIYYRHRWVQTVHATVQKYCLIETGSSVPEGGPMEGGRWSGMVHVPRSFRNPTRADVEDCDVVVATLSTSRHLASLGLPAGHFTHVLLDEAAQAMECEALLPLALCDSFTRVVLAGDHMQLSPEVFSPFAAERGLGKSLLERLYELYPTDYPCR